MMNHINWLKYGGFAIATLSVQLKDHLLGLTDYHLFPYRFRLKILFSHFYRLNDCIRLSLIIFYCTQYVIVFNHLWSYSRQKPWFTHQVRLHNWHKCIRTHVNDDTRWPATQKGIPQNKKILACYSYLTHQSVLILRCNKSLKVPVIHSNCQRR